MITCMGASEDAPPVWLLAEDMDAALLAVARFASELPSWSDFPVIASSRCRIAASSSEFGCTQQSKVPSQLQIKQQHMTPHKNKAEGD